ncbi:hypothetical protein KC351_g9985 [Hortaea werneckii]|nr:hypothetical protein KC351_g9985 [Hortaea werneckii]
MAATGNHHAVPPDTLITIKVSVNDNLKKLKLPLRDLGANVLPDKLRNLLNIKPEQVVVFERFSDSAGGYITLDPNSPQVFKTLIRAAKAKLKLRLKATVTPMEPQEQEVNKGLPQDATDPVIVSSPVYQESPRDSTALGCRSVGSGIFQFREARNSQTLSSNTDEAQVSQPAASTNKAFFDGLASQTRLPVRTKEQQVNILINSHGHPWSVYCNACDKAMADAHFHCSICDGGDYDLCQDCVVSGKLCPGEGHWLIKRSIQDGKVVNSTTERISPRSTRVSKPIKIEDLVQSPSEEKKEMPGSFADETKTLTEEPQISTRTCNSCVVVLPEREFVTCTTCDDFDLCISCHTGGKHGHHPAHGFKPATDDTVLSLAAETMLSPGRNVRHNAICDGCDSKIYGVRHKCLSCPDWDFCGECVKDARHTHPRHRFAPIYNPIPDQYVSPVRHYGIFCDGPLCNHKSDQSYITGVRYKCAVCHDTDFCASCEASPGNHHNRTHPLIKFKMPVRNVSITTENEDVRGNVRMMGDRQQAAAQDIATETETPVALQGNAASQVKTMAEFEPSDAKEAQPIPVFTSDSKLAGASESVAPHSALLNAHFIQDSVPDGMTIAPGARFTQMWTLKNPGPYAWPAGCSVRYTGGDNMLNVDNGHPSSVTDIADATESNVVGREVQVGEEAAFKVTLKAPTREGKSISYWRLKAADGTPFGHRLWCDVDVKVPAVPSSVAPKPEQPTFASPFEAAEKAHTLRLQQANLQAQRQAQFQQMMMARRQRDAQLLQQREMIQRQQAAQRAQEQAQDSNSGAPPTYESSENMHARLAGMRAEQQRRRDAMMAHFRAQQTHAMQATPASVSPEAEKARKEAAKQRVEHIKAKIMRNREEQARKALEAQRAAAAEQKNADETEKVKKIIEEVTKSVEEEEQVQKVADEEKMEGSQMVFPKLEKESPASSTYQSATSSSIKGKPAYVESEADEIERAATPRTAPAAPASVISTIASPTVERGNDDDEFEVMSAEDSEEEDDGFLTDEEYDILDASDEETVASK